MGLFTLHTCRETVSHVYWTFKSHKLSKLSIPEFSGSHCSKHLLVLVFFGGFLKILKNQYFFRFTDNVTKDGDILKYTINVRKLYGYADIITITR